MARRGGWRRRGSQRRGFRYEDSRGRVITDAIALERIESLRIPPAWNDVWISPRASAKLQATGLDKAGRRQYLYHPEFRAQQEQAKFDKLVRFAERLPALRKAMNEHLDQEPLTFEWTAAVAVRLINEGWFRVGSERYARSYKTFGITTLRKGHVRVSGSRVSFRFRAKHRMLCRTVLVDADLGAAMKELLALPGGRRLFRFRRDDEIYNLGARKGLPHLGRHAGRRDPARRGEAGRYGDRAEADRRRGDASGRRAPREHAGRRAFVVREPGRGRAVSRRENDRRFPAPAFACGRREGFGARPGGASTAQPAALVAHSPRA
jgi:Eukaryotic DNA topoisomerase I, catalytic core